MIYHIRTIEFLNISIQKYNRSQTPFSLIIIHCANNKITRDPYYIIIYIYLQLRIIYRGRLVVVMET